MDSAGRNRTEEDRILLGKHIVLALVRKELTSCESTLRHASRRDSVLDYRLDGNERPMEVWLACRLFLGPVQADPGGFLAFVEQKRLLLRGCRQIYAQCMVEAGT